MNAIATEILLESKTARDGQLTQVSHEAASDVLSKAKALVFALWQGTGAATTEQMAEYYDVPSATLRQLFKRHRDELDSDGVKVLRGKALNEVSDMMSLTSTASNITIWTPRAALRLGMLLRDSDVAKQVRTVLLDVAEGDRMDRSTTSQPLPPQSSLDVLAQSLQALTQVAQSMAEVERRQREQEVILTQLVAGKEQAEAELAALPLSQESPADIPARGRTNMIVRNYAQRNSISYPAIWSKLYLELYYRYKFDVKSRCRRSGRKPLDQIEVDGMLEALYAIASEVLA
ncbi:hypothetical protein [Microcoleus sp. Pol12B5]|uniref:hypothetical protein n=1 Tax=Microcoleus sp. Pol12B5 TaxID=3055396 RepID=UPI002FCE8C65